jgi:hypothetical protein
MSNQTVETIRMYNQAYHDVHGSLPNVRTNNGWIRINNSPKSFRPHEVREMAENLQRRAREDQPRENIERIQEERENHSELINMLRESIRERERQANDIWDVREELNARVQAQIEQEAEALFDDVKDDDVHVRIQKGWKSYVNKNTIIMFLNRLYEKAGNSAFDMQRMMDIFIHTGDFHDDDEPDCDECDVAMELEYIRDKIEEKNTEIGNFRHRIRIKDKEIELLKNQLLKKKMEMQELKNNSVVFSMDEI